MKNFCGQVKDLETHLWRLKSDLHNCAGFIQEPKKLKDSVRVLYSHYVPLDDSVSASQWVDESSWLWVFVTPILLRNTDSLRVVLIDTL